MHIDTEAMQRAANTMNAAVSKLETILSFIPYDQTLARADELATRFENTTEKFEQAVERLILDGPRL